MCEAFARAFVGTADYFGEEVNIYWTEKDEATLVNEDGEIVTVIYSASPKGFEDFHDVKDKVEDYIYDIELDFSDSFWDDADDPW